MKHSGIWEEEPEATEASQAAQEALRERHADRDAFQALLRHDAYKRLQGAMAVAADRKMRVLSIEPLDSQEHTCGKLIGFIAAVQWAQRYVARMAADGTQEPIP